MSWMTGGSQSTIQATVRMKNDQYVRGAKETIKSTKKIGDEADRTAKKVGHLDQSLKTMGLFRWASYAGFVTLASAFGSLAHEALGFEDAMAKVKAVTGVQGPEFEKLWQDALTVAGDFRATSQETANALYQVTAAGISAKDSIEVLRTSLQLAAASGYDQAASAELMVGTMAQFALKAPDAARVADELATAVNISGINMDDLGLSMKYIGPSAMAASQSLEQTLFMVALLGKVGGAKGSNVGTGLATGLDRIVAPAEDGAEALAKLGLTAKDMRDANGDVKPFVDILALVSSRMNKIKGSAERLDISGDIFGKDAADVWRNLLNAFRDQPEVIRALADEFNNWHGAAKKAQEVMDDTVTGSLQRLWGSINNITTSKVMTERGGIQDWIDNLDAKIKDFDLETWLDDNKEAIDAILASASAFGDFVMNGLVPAFTGLNDALSPALVPVLEVLASTMQLLAEHADTLQPLIIALTAMFVAQRYAGVGWGIPGLGPRGGDPAKGGDPARALSKFSKFTAMLGPWGIGFAAAIIGAEQTSNLLDRYDPGVDPTPINPNSPLGRYGYKAASYAAAANPEEFRVPPPPVNPDRIRPEDYAFFQAIQRLNPTFNIKVQLDGRELGQAVATAHEDEGARR